MPKRNKDKHYYHYDKRQFMYPVRWLLTGYGVGDDPYTGSLADSLKWELANPREKSFAYAGKNASVGSASIGLLVDMEASEISALYLGDAYTLLESRYNEKIQSDRLLSNAIVEDHRTYRGNIPSYQRDTRQRKRRSVRIHTTSKAYSNGSFWEGIGRLKYSGIVVRRIKNNRTYQSKLISEAIALSRQFGIPYLGVVGSFRPGKYYGRSIE